MGRINIYSTDDYGDKTLEGWFDTRTATRYDQDTEWDGYNMVGVITRSNFIDEYLYRTKGGRWVLNHDESRYNHGPDTYEFLTDEQARDWLIRSECNDDAVEQHFGELEDERGPGRPEVGPAFSLRFPADLLARVDAAAKTEGVSRAQKIRNAVEASLVTAAFDMSAAVTPVYDPTGRAAAEAAARRYAEIYAPYEHVPRFELSTEDHQAIDAAREELASAVRIAYPECSAEDIIAVWRNGGPDTAVFAAHEIVARCYRTGESLPV